MERMGSVPNLPIKQSISIGTMLNFDGDGHRHGDGKCKQAFTTHIFFILIIISDTRIPKEGKAHVTEWPSTCNK